MLNLVDFFAIAPYYISLSSLAKGTFDTPLPSSSCVSFFRLPSADQKECRQSCDLSKAACIREAPPHFECCDW